MTGIYLLLGSNLGNRKQQLREAQQLLELRVGKVQNTSSVYSTEAWEMNDAPDFLNQVLLVNSSFEPLIVLKKILKIETDLGRARNAGYENRSMDIDILYYGDLILNHHELIVPHPRIPQRRFVLEPLAELAPEFVHPQLGLTNQQLLNQCTDPLMVSRL